MNNEVKCEKCNQPMRQIGPFAKVKPEGQPSEKWDGNLDFECRNDNCKNLGKIITVNA